MSGDLVLAGMVIASPQEMVLSRRISKRRMDVIKRDCSVFRYLFLLIYRPDGPRVHRHRLWSPLRT